MHRLRSMVFAIRDADRIEQEGRLGRTGGGQPRGHGRLRAGQGGGDAAAGKQERVAEQLLAVAPLGSLPVVGQQITPRPARRRTGAQAQQTTAGAELVGAPLGGRGAARARASLCRQALRKSLIRSEKPAPGSGAGCSPPPQPH